MAVALNTTDFRKVYFLKSYKIFLLMCRTCNHFWYVSNHSEIIFRKEFIFCSERMVPVPTIL